MIVYHCPYCREMMQIAESELGARHDCPACGVASECPESAWHAQRLERLGDRQRTGPLTAAEWHEAAIHYRGLGKTRKAARAEQLADRAEQRAVAEAAAEAAAVAAPVEEPWASSPWMTDDDGELNRPAGSEAGFLLLGVVAIATCLSIGIVVFRGLVAYTVLTAGPALAIAAACALRGGDCGVNFILGLLFTPAAGLVHLVIATHPDRAEADDVHRLMGAVMACAAGATWAGAAVWAFQTGRLALWLSGTGMTPL